MLRRDTFVAAAESGGRAPCFELFDGRGQRRSSCRAASFHAAFVASIKRTAVCCTAQQPKFH
jgi:hypothetical protein